MIYPLTPVTPAQALQIAIRSSILVVEAQMVIGMRVMGMMGLWHTSPGEPVRMVGEKIAAVQDAGLAATRAAMTGKSPAVMLDHALKPIQRRTRANVSRLARRGPAQG